MNNVMNIFATSGPVSHHALAVVTHCLQTAGLEKAMQCASDMVVAAAAPSKSTFATNL